MKKLILFTLVGVGFIAARIDAQVTFLYNNDFPTNDMASATRPESTPSPPPTRSNRAAFTRNRVKPLEVMERSQARRFVSK